MNQRTLLIILVLCAVVALAQAKMITFTLKANKGRVKTFTKDDETTILGDVAREFSSSELGMFTDEEAVKSKLGMNLDLKKTLKMAGIKDGSVHKVKLYKSRFGQMLLFVLTLGGGE